MKRSLSQMVAVLLLVLGSTLVLATPRAKSTVTVYIMADGSVNPSSAPIRRDGDTYTLTDDIAFLDDTNGIVIERDNIAVDGASFRLQGAMILGGTSSGIYLAGRSNVTIKNMEIKAFEYGIKINCSSHNTISGNNITENYHFGILLVGSSNTTISRNNITENSHIGVWLDGSSNNTIFQNNITDAEFGVLLVRSNNNRVSSSFIARNAYQGLLLSESSNNCIDHNNFINNTRQAFSDGANVWDDGYPSGGNYWSDYNGTDLKTGPFWNETGSDGIGDTPYAIDNSNQDNYPLMGMFQSYDVTYFSPPMVAHSCNVTVISNSTISNFVTPIWIEHPEVIFIEFNVTGEQGTTGFCRVSFPTAMMNGTYHVLVNGTEVPYILLPCSNADYSYLYFNYTHSTEGVIITPELPSFLILPMFMVVTLLAVIFHRRKQAT